eukprot:scaffold249573_cov16-Prasinocladus_malaysianus.AAC.1
MIMYSGPKRFAIVKKPFSSFLDVPKKGQNYHSRHRDACCVQGARLGEVDYHETMMLFFEQQGNAEAAARFARAAISACQRVRSPNDSTQQP